jgi:hypothetical protein
VLAVDLANLNFIPTGTFDTANVGTGKTVTIATTLTGTASGNYAVASSTTTADITTKVITASGITASKTYDGTATAPLSLGGATLLGVASVDVANVALAGTAGLFSTSNVGINLPVTQANVTLTGSAASNYTLTPPTITGSITAQNLTVTGITANNKPADGNATATLNTGAAALSGVVTADIPNVTLVTAGATGTFSQVDPGTGLTVTVSGLTLTGSAATNYTLTQPTTTADIT